MIHTNTQGSIRTECCGTSNYWNPVVRTHHSSPTVVALASCSSKGRVQARVPGSPVVGWTDTVVPSFRHSAHCRYRPPSASICVWENMCCSTHTQQLQRQKFFCCRASGALEDYLLTYLQYRQYRDRQTDREAAGPRVWNALPSHLRQDMNYKHFKHALKGHYV